jgi:hypothetical protein
MHRIITAAAILCRMPSQHRLSATYLSLGLAMRQHIHPTSHTGRITGTSGSLIRRIGILATNKEKQSCL